MSRSSARGRYHPSPIRRRGASSCRSHRCPERWTEPTGQACGLACAGARDAPVVGAVEARGGQLAAADRRALLGAGRRRLHHPHRRLSGLESADARDAPPGFRIALHGRVHRPGRAPQRGELLGARRHSPYGRTTHAELTHELPLRGRVRGGVCRSLSRRRSEHAALIGVEPLEGLAAGEQGQRLGEEREVRC